MERIFGSDSEWIETDGLGGFASGTVSGVRTRRYHALLLAARTPPTDRCVLVNGLEVWADRKGEETPLCAHCYDPGVLHPAGFKWIESFTNDPWPTWVYKLDDGTRIRHEVFVPRGWPACVVLWKVLTPVREASLRVRPLLSVRGYHSLHSESAQFSFHAEAGEGLVLGEIAELAAAFTPSRERHLETTAQGRAFVEIARSAWNCDTLDLLSSHVTGPITYPVAVGVLAAGHRISLSSTLHAFLHAATSNWISAGVRLIPLGQTDSQHVLAALEGAIAATAEKSLLGSLDDLGSATFRADLASMRHETQYTRLFRS